MALTAGTIWAMSATATTGNVNGGGFNIANTNFLTDLAATSATGNSPVVTSATYTFVAGDVNNWIYIKAGTNWTVGWYQITSVTAGAATINATIGAAIASIGSTGVVSYNTVAGCATVASPTAGTFGVDYSQTDTAVINGITDFASTASSTTLTSATAGFTPVMVGNIFHQTTTGVGGFGVVGWYEIVSYTNATTVVLDRTPDNGTGSVGCTGYVGGSSRLNALEDTFQSQLPGGGPVFIKGGTITMTGNVTTSNANLSATNPQFWIGFTSIRGDACNGSNRPTIAAGANTTTWNSSNHFYNLNITLTSAAGWSGGGMIINCKGLNSSTTANRSAFTNGNYWLGNEVISQNGHGNDSGSSPPKMYGNYIHDCATGVAAPTSANTFIVCVDNIFAHNSSTCLATNNASGTHQITGNTFYGRQAKMGTGFTTTHATDPSNLILSNIFYGLTTGINITTSAAANSLSQYNDFFNNTTDNTNWLKSSTDLALDPQFTNASEITGTTGSGSGSVLTDTNANFSGVTDGVDFLHQVSGTGATVGCYLITSHTSTTLTVNNPVGTNATADRVYWVSNGHNFGIGANLKAMGFPSFINATGSQTTSYVDTGAVQSQHSTGGAGGTPIMQSGIIQGLGAI